MAKKKKQEPFVDQHDKLDELLKKLEEAEMEYTQKLKTADLESIIARETKREEK